MLKPIKTEQQYDDALARVYELLQLEVKEGSAESDELEVLSILIKDYELSNYPVPSPDPLDAIRFRLDQMDMSENVTGGYFGLPVAQIRNFVGQTQVESGDDSQAE